MNVAIWWLRRDLRLSDNQALAGALASAGSILPVFILDPVLENSQYVGQSRKDFLLRGLHRLDADLRSRGSRLILRRGRPQQVLADIVRESGAGAVFAEEDYSPYARRRDIGVARSLPLHLVSGLSLFPPGAVMKQDGTPYVVYTPFCRAWLSLASPERDAILATPDHIPTPAGVSGQPIPDPSTGNETQAFPTGEAEALRRLKAFAGPNDGTTHSPIHDYAHTRDQMHLEGTSRLSPYMRFGMLSARQSVVAAFEAIHTAPGTEAREGARSWLNELVWREFFFSILAYFPEVRKTAFRPQLRHIAWNDSHNDFEAWCEGQTGYPIVDAGMRQLKTCNWMHNRTRMIVASFLVKDLLIDWSRGEMWFMQHLLDGDPAANNGGWQWTAGTGTDAAPYFRIFNPVAQGKKFDPKGEFVRRWVPELAGVPDKYIHEPWKMSIAEQHRAGCLVGTDYPSPIVDHADARRRTLDAYNSARQQAGEA